MKAPLVTALLLGSSIASADDLWVSTDVLKRHSCPSNRCGVLGEIYYRSKATVLERREGWGRITRYYDAFCEAGKSRYFKGGTADCLETNGVKNSQVAEWIELKHLAAVRPADPAAAATGTAALIGGSDDFKTYKAVFVKITDQLLAAKRCSTADFKEWGGWMRSTTHKASPTYFMYCGGSTPAHKIYLDAAAGTLVRK